MHVAVAGSGDLARYLSEELPKVGHQLTILTRSQKPEFELPDVSQYITDYTPESLAVGLAESEALISTIAGSGQAFVDVHLALIKACQQSPKCKRFVGSEYVGDIETYPDQPGFYWQPREPIRQALRELKDLEWTLVSIGWLADYIVPLKNRYIKDFGDAHPLSHATGKMTIPGTGNEPTDLTWARDVAKALGSLVKAPAWEPYIYMSGQRTTWNKVAATLKSTTLPDLKEEHVSLYQQCEAYRAAKNRDDEILALNQMWSACGASAVPVDKVQAHKQKYFSDVEFRTPQDGLIEFKNNPDVIV